MTTFKDRLHDIFIDHYGEKLLAGNSKVIEQAIIDLFLEIVGDNDAWGKKLNENPEEWAKIRNQLRAELRNKLKGDN